MDKVRTFLAELNREYLQVHREKEELFWSTHMGTSHDNESSTQAEQRWKRWISDPERLRSVRENLAALQALPDSREKQELETGLEGWIALFEANIFTSEEAKAIWEETIRASAQLFEKRSAHSLTYADDSGRKRDSSLLNLFTNVRSAASEDVRRSSRDALLDLEDWVLANGLLELVEMRNRFARASGFRNYFEYSVRKNERMSVDQLFGLLDKLETTTRKQNARSLADLQRESGSGALKPHNAAYGFFGDTTGAMDPYFPFSTSLESWVSSFSRMNIDFADAELTLDLLERNGKYENGFCHGPVPAYVDDGTWNPAKVNFAATARPDLVGSGQFGLEVFFHEGGHAAHFANVRMNAPCFSQEFAPTSMACAETQSMFCDSLLEDADWLSVYARDRKGNIIPGDLVRESVRARHRSLAFDLRVSLIVPYFERAMYELPTDERTPSSVKRLARETEKRIFGYDVNPRPVLSIPHLLSNDAACSYQGYLVALIAVYQTRAHFKDTYGYVCDNPVIGPQLATHFWGPGNSRSLEGMLTDLTGEALNPRFLAEEYALSLDDAVMRAEKLITSAQARSRDPIKDLHASIRVVDGDREIASNRNSTEEMFRQFASYIEERYPPPAM